MAGHLADLDLLVAKAAIGLALLVGSQQLVGLAGKRRIVAG
ncbi:MAG: hypothetical protein VYC32_15335 [Planctomycetota bacterium]|nr:hypothetical protein [Planctomycetota bacterium]